ncbi:hypothetical protein HBHAL_3940 [Halobacillus halophilus DSM 2266]|uniref:Uncharacterized protein n=1 Tax=Halobacillus halophilus (strain ATCC 35676 / DSM 2266 / JCM 20832 / KCTC 3685 / LMG 17431 / NBRC 102448 / NCIMB 2269) TaxID=866895 RepID=I0JQ62_HALH3|nr:hypothetical protein HBHAL_3940 [Halobacillus halophilus DSM 2266]
MPKGHGLNMINMVHDHVRQGSYVALPVQLLMVIAGF